MYNFSQIADRVKQNRAIYKAFADLRNAEVLKENPPLPSDTWSKMAALLAHILFWEHDSWARNIQVTELENFLNENCAGYKNG